MSTRLLRGATRLLLAALVLVPPGCNGGGTSTPPRALRIAAASDLQSALPRLAERFRARTGIEATLIFGASGRLSEQIRQGAPCDVFLAANQSFVRDLAADRLIKPESVQAYARGTLVLAVYHELGDRIRSLDDLTRPEVKKIALAQPRTAPYGAAGKQVIERARLWDKLAPKIVYADSVRQALIHAQRGDAEAAFVGRAIADVPEIRSVDIDPALYDPIIQALGIVSETTHAAEADEFARFVLSEEGQGVLKEFGFAPPTAGEKPRPAVRAPEPAEADRSRP